jgi:Fe-S cluster assembly iron-binding protein IscA
MIDVTEQAKKELKELLDKNVDNPEACLRLKTNDDGKLGLGIDVEKPDDQVLEYEGSKLLVMETGLADKLKDAALDVVDSEEGRRLVISAASK